MFRSKSGAMTPYAKESDGKVTYSSGFKRLETKTDLFDEKKLKDASETDAAGDVPESK